MKGQAIACVLTPISIPSDLSRTLREPSRSPKAPEEWREEGKREKADGQDQFYQDIMAASQSDRPVIIGPTAAKKFYASIGKEPKAKL